MSLRNYNTLDPIVSTAKIKAKVYKVIILNINMKKRTQKTYLIGYRAEGIGTYKTSLKPLGYFVAGLGFVCLGVGAFPNGLGFLFYPLGFALLGLVGIRLNIKKKIGNKIRLFRYKRGLI